MPIEPDRIAYWEAISFAVLFGCTFLYKLLRNRRFILGLVFEGPLTAPVAGRSFSLHRIQLLLVSLVLFSKVLFETLSAAFGTGIEAMPQVGLGSLFLFGASAATYAAVKMSRTLNQ